MVIDGGTYEENVALKDLLLKTGAKAILEGITNRSRKPMGEDIFLLKNGNRAAMVTDGIYDSEKRSMIMCTAIYTDIGNSAAGIGAVAYLDVFDDEEFYNDYDSILCSFKENDNSAAISGSAIPAVEEDMVGQNNNEADDTQKMEDALERAKSWQSVNHYSKAALRKVMVDTLYFTEEEAEYAVENVGTDWKEAALSRAKSWQNVNHYSKAALRKVIVDTLYFTEEEAEYAVENVGTDWKEAALTRAKSWQNVNHYSKEALRKVMVDTLYFTEEEAEYAIAGCF